MKSKTYKSRVKLPVMAQLLSRSAKQFRADVVNYKIPHLRLGRDRLFDPEEVEQMLLAEQTAQKSSETCSTEQTPTGNQKSVYRSSLKSGEPDDTERYEILLGLR